jgi:hypothetical protein
MFLIKIIKARLQDGFSQLVVIKIKSIFKIKNWKIKLIKFMILFCNLAKASAASYSQIIWAQY